MPLDLESVLDLEPVTNSPAPLALEPLDRRAYLQRQMEAERSHASALDPALKMLEGKDKPLGQIIEEFAAPFRTPEQAARRTERQNEEQAAASQQSGEREDAAAYLRTLEFKETQGALTSEEAADLERLRRAKSLDQFFGLFRGGARGVKNLAEGMTTPQNLALLPVAGSGGPSARAAGALFSAQAVHDAPAVLSQAKEAIQSGDTAAIGESAVAIPATVLMALGGAGAALHSGGAGDSPAVSRVPRETPRTIVRAQVPKLDLEPIAPERSASPEGPKEVMGLDTETGEVTIAPPVSSREGGTGDSPVRAGNLPAPGTPLEIDIDAGSGVRTVQARATEHGVQVGELTLPWDAPALLSVREVKPDTAPPVESNIEATKRMAEENRSAMAQLRKEKERQHSQNLQNPEPEPVVRPAREAPRPLPNSENSVNSVKAPVLPERPWDIIDDIENNVGQLSLKSARAFAEDFKPTGPLKKLFQGVNSLDDALSNLHQMGLARRITTEGELLDALHEASAVRANWETEMQRMTVGAEPETRNPQLDTVDTGTLGSLGMGGAKPGEFNRGPGTATSIKNATVDAERQARGLPPAMEPARRSFETVWDEAMARVDRAPETADALIGELTRQPRALTDIEDAILLQRQIDLQNEYGKSTRDLAAAHDDAAQFPNRLADFEEAKVRVTRLSDQLLQLYEVNKAAGTETGRGLNARRMMAHEDFSLAKMETDLRVAQDGAPLTDTQRKSLDEAHAKIEATQAALDEALTRLDKEKAARAATDATNDLIERVKSDGDVDPQVRSIAERITVRLESAADAARARLKSKFARTSAGVDPTIVADLSIVGAAHIARGTLEFTRWSRAMLLEFGDAVAPYLKAAWTESNRRVDDAVDAAVKGPQRDKVSRAVRKQDTRTQREALISGMKEARFDGRPNAELGRYVQRLAETFVRDGIKTRDALVDAVHQLLVLDFDPKLTRRQAMDAISGYGDFKALNPDAIKAELRELKGQMQQVAKLEDITARAPLQKTGIERRKIGDEERRLIQQVNEAKRKFGVVTTDPARQLKSALDAIKTRMRNRLADLKFELASKTRIVREKSEVKFDAEAEALKLELQTLRAEHDKVFSDEIDQASRVALAERALERSIKEYEQRVAAGDIARRQRTPPISNAKLDALRARRDALRDELDALRELANPAKTPEQRALSALKTRLKNATASLRERTAAGDFSPRVRKPITLDAEALKAKAANAQAKAAWQRGVIETRLANRTGPQKIWAGVKESLNLPRAAMASWDVSAVLRQGGFITLGHPLRAARSLGPMFRALASEKQSAIIEQEILSRPNAALYARSKLYLAPHESLKLSAMEEALMSRLAKFLPGVKQSNRAYVTFLNKLRADSFDTMLDSLQRRGPDLSQPELQAIANYINVSTGRGNMGHHAAAAETLATVFFSPRLVLSRFQLLAGQPLYRGSARTRTAVATEYGRFLAGLAVVYGLANLAGADLEDDPRSSDFGKLKFGNTRVDPLAGLAQNTVLLSRLAAGETTSTAGKVKAIRGSKLPYGADTSADVIARFLRSKLSPIVGAGVDLASGQNLLGQPVTPGQTAANLAIPLSFRDIQDIMLAHGIPAGTALGILSLFGWGLQHYDQKP